MQIEFQKKRDGTTVLRCIRDDGTATWQKGPAGFFNFHDLTHYAVETTLGIRFGFFGIVATGWDIEDFGSPWPRGKIRPEWAMDAALAENLTSALDRERAGVPLVAEEFNGAFLDACAESGITAARTVTAPEIAAARALRDELFARWRALPLGETLILPFPVSGSARRAGGEDRSRCGI